MEPSQNFDELIRGNEVGMVVPYLIVSGTTVVSFWFFNIDVLTAF